MGDTSQQDEATLTFWQALKQLPQGFLDLFAAWAEDIKLRRERDWTAEYRKAYEAGREAVLAELGFEPEAAAAKRWRCPSCASRTYVYEMQPETADRTNGAGTRHVCEELRRLADEWEQAVARMRRSVASMAEAEGWDDEDQLLNGRLDGRLSCAEELRRRAAELAQEAAL